MYDNMQVPSLSASVIIFFTSSFVGVWPIDLITLPNSLQHITPSLFLSKRENDSRQSTKLQHLTQLTDVHDYNI
jgi:hypothetical protein